MLSFQVRGGAPEALAVAATLRLFTRATSLGGADSLIEHRASIEPPGHGHARRTCCVCLDRPGAPRRPDRRPCPGARLSRCHRIT
ncbi:MAG: PLP-dependent transferase [Rhodopseudomonas palustris]|nr:PLP-dependent transferase [Rhodopseudomonas palustris]